MANFRHLSVTRTKFPKDYPPTYETWIRVITAHNTKKQVLGIADRRGVNSSSNQVKTRHNEEDGC